MFLSPFIHVFVWIYFNFDFVRDDNDTGMLFSKMDKKRDGIVRVKEVSNAVKDLCPNTTSLQLDVFSRMVDMNNTGIAMNLPYMYGL